MNNFHDPIKHVKFFRQALSQDKKPIGFFISAGCPLAVKMLPDKEWPLIPDVKGLTKHIHTELAAKIGEEKNKYDLLLDELRKSDGKVDNIEDILSFIRALKEVSSGNSVRGFEYGCLRQMEIDICQSIVKKLHVSLPDEQSPYHKLASWISSIDREKPLEVFTTNYDLLMEQAFEEVSVPYFDGFVGSRQPFFDLRALEDNLIPKHWTRLWKIHGSINWFQKENKDVWRTSLGAKCEDSHLIYPSHLKYEQSRKMPYLALIDQLTRFIRQSSSLLILSGYSFSDEHLNDTIINALKANQNAMVIALLFKNLNDYPKAIKLASNRPNLALWGFDEGVIGTVRGVWKSSENAELNSKKYCFYPLENVRNNTEQKATTDIVSKLQLGDFAVFADFLQDLVGDNQIRVDNEK